MKTDPLHSERRGERARARWLGALALVLAGVGSVGAQAPAEPEDPPEVRLGERLFMDTRFSAPQGDLRNSCRVCHLLDEDPQGLRAYVDFLARSWVPWRSEDPRRDGPRNSPTLVDSGNMPRLHFDGEFASMEDLVKKTLSTRNFGWLPGEESQAFERVRAVVLDDRGEGAEGAYREQFESAYGVRIDALSRDELIDWVARSISDYVRSLDFRMNSPYDEFIEMNDLAAGPAEGEEVKRYAERHLAQLDRRARGGALQYPRGFSERELEGYEIFLRTEGDRSVGNCVACHAPPKFTDYAFHNTGVSQMEYDSVHGDGSFARLEIPAAPAAERPIKKFADEPTRRDPSIADLGHWNFADADEEGLRREGESESEFLERMVATFKTPTLRNLRFTQPYMHTGGFSTLEKTMTSIAASSELAREGRLRAADEELAAIRIADRDIGPLLAFLGSLTEVYD